MGVISLFKRQIVLKTVIRFEEAILIRAIEIELDCMIYVTESTETTTGVVG